MDTGQKQLQAMKTTAKRLSEVYCIPKIDADCWALGIGKPAIGLPLIGDKTGTWTRHVKQVINRTDIAVSQFIDLMGDSISPWRLIEDGFEDRSAMGFRELRLAINESEGHYIEVRGSVSLLVNGEVIKTNATTYTDIINLYNLVR